VVTGLSERIQRAAPRLRPFVTLAYAQSLDGSIAAHPGRPMALSGDAALVLTHELRASHDVILVGIGTVLADDPRLDVRLTAGRNPRPVVVDTRLRIPSESRLLAPGAMGPWLATLATDGPSAQRVLSRGGRVLAGRATGEGRVDLAHLLGQLYVEGVRSVMVEGGATIIRSFLLERLVDYAVITISPRFVGGLPALGMSPLPGRSPRLFDWTTATLGGDLLISGEVRFDP
jgi:riboflavin-specific deaminase-like protein